MPRIGFHRRPALLSGLAATMAVGALSARWAPPSSSLLLGWCAGVVAYLAVALRTGFGMSPEVARRRAAELDEGRNAVLGATLAATLVSLGAVVADLAHARGSPAAPWSAALAVATVGLSWTFVHVLFAHRYAHEHALRGGLCFPGSGEPDFGEFLYLAFTVGMTAQVSDATTASPAMRRLVLAHALVAFVFNAAVLATAVNLAAGLAG